MTPKNSLGTKKTDLSLMIFQSQIVSDDKWLNAEV